MIDQYHNLRRKVTQYKEILQNTQTYRQAWQDRLKAEIIAKLTALLKEADLQATIEERKEMENLEAIVLSLGNVKSGVSQEVATDYKRDLIKHNGSLIYQQLFNGKVLVLINYPYIENYGQPQPPRTIAIYRPEELNDNYYLRHLETFVQEVLLWEDFDDDREDPVQHNQHIGFRLNFAKPDGSEKEGGALSSQSE